MNFLVLSLLFCISQVPLFGALDVSAKIDQAIEFGRSGDFDGCQKLLHELLQGHLTDDEKVSVLYNLATVTAGQSQYEKAVALFAQITPDLFEKTVTTTPLTAMLISYNYACSLVKLSEVKILQEDVHGYLEEAKEHVNRASTIYSHMNPVDRPSFSFTSLYEEIALLRVESERIAFLRTMSKENKEELLKSGIYDLQALFLKLVELKAAQNSPTIGLYVEDFGIKYGYKVKLFLERIFLYLQVPSPVAVAKMHTFLVDELLSIESAFLKAIDKKMLDQVMDNLYMLIVGLELVANEGKKNEIEALLQQRIKVIEQKKSIQDRAEKLLLNYLQRKIAFADPKEQKLGNALLRELKSAPLSLSKAQYDLEFYQNLSAPLDASFQKLYETAMPSFVQFEALSARLDLEGFVEANRYIRQAYRSTLQKKLILKSWYLVHPKVLLGYIAGSILVGMKNAPIAVSLPLLLEPLKDFASKHKEYVPAVLRLESQRVPFDQYITLVWLVCILQEKPTDVKALSGAITQSLSLQKDLTVSLQQAPSSVEWGKELQQSIVKKIASELEIPTLQDKTKTKLKAIFAHIERLLGRGASERTYAEVEILLEEALKLLENETKEETSTDTKKPKEEPTTELKLQKQPLQIAPETAIRLLQEMERDDASLFQAPLHEKSGSKPW